jgi:ATP-dependent RNA helicase RhlE
MTFAPLGLDERLLQAVAAMGFVTPTAVQSETIPAVLAGRDVLGRSQTGTGKTAAFGLPALQRMLPDAGRRFRLLVIAPTRELAAQVHEHLTALARFTPFKGLLVVGGTDRDREEHHIRLGADWVVGTPGRLLDHLLAEHLDIGAIQTLVLDEADRLLEMGFLPTVRRIVSYAPERRQTLLFSATLPPEMTELARAILHQPVRIEVGSASSADLVRETLWPVATHQKVDLLEAILRAHAIPAVIVFARTKARADRLSKRLLEDGFRVETLHADRSMTERRQALERLRTGEIPVLVATDLAARGLDVSNITHVINYDVPAACEDYIHRVGRTGRAGALGEAYTFMGKGEEHLVAKVEHLIRKRLETNRLEGFDYEDERPDSFRRVKERQREATPYNSRRASKDKKESPFTKSGRVRRGYEVPDPEKDLQEVARKKIKMRKKLPHQR